MSESIHFSSCFCWIYTKCEHIRTKKKSSLIPIEEKDGFFLHFQPSNFVELKILQDFLCKVKLLHGPMQFV